jgi:septum formation protein
MLVLASASPRRRELLERAGVTFTVRPTHADETQHQGEAALAYVRRVATAKAAAAIRRVDQWALAADTIVVIDGLVLGKADDEREAAAMLARLAGRTHQVTTAVALHGPGGEHAFEVTSDVDVVALDDAGIADYVASGEWRGKAGAYAVQGIGGALVRSVRGSVTNVIGLPLVETLELLRATGAADVSLARGRPA